VLDRPRAGPSCGTCGVAKLPKEARLAPRLVMRTWGPQGQGVKGVKTMVKPVGDRQIREIKEETLDNITVTVQDCTRLYTVMLDCTL
jgi:hypothetical protein